MSSKPGQPALVVATCGLFGFFSFALMPVCLEVGVECTYPVAEATSAGLLWMAGYIGGFFVVVTYYCPIHNPDLPDSSNQLILNDNFCDPSFKQNI